MKNIKVINIKGKAKGTYHYIGRGSVLGNPFVLGKDGNRTEVIASYKRLLWSQLQSLGPMGKAVMSFASSSLPITLGCHCAPLPCHGHVIKAAILWVRSQA